MAGFEVPPWLDNELQGVNRHIKRICTSRTVPMQRMMDSILSAKGKQIRPILTVLCSRLMDKKPDVKELAAVIEICHTASLIHDDIIDEGEIRRGAPSIQKEYGKEMAVYAGDFMIFSAIGRTNLMNKLWYREMFDKLETMCDGEVSQFENRFNTDLTEAEYISYIKGKTSSMFEIACVSGARAAKFPRYAIRAVEKFAKSFGVLFQLRDDYLDYKSSDEEYRKTVRSDFWNGYYTLPIICAFNSPITGKEMRECSVLTEETDKEELWGRTLSLIDRANGFAYTKNKIKEYADDALDALSVFRESEAKAQIEKIIDYLCCSIDM